MKKLYRSNKNRMVAGVLGGIADYFKIDPVIVRVLFFALMFIAHAVPVLVLYVVCMLVIPLEPKHETVFVKPDEVKEHNISHEENISESK
jgi:phage shock protein C